MRSLLEKLQSGRLSPEDQKKAIADLRHDIRDVKDLLTRDRAAAMVVTLKSCVPLEEVYKGGMTQFKQIARKHYVRAGFVEADIDKVWQYIERWMLGDPLLQRYLGKPPEVL